MNIKSSLLLVASLIACSLSANGATLRIACGSTNGGVDAAGQVWMSDRYYGGGTDYSRSNMVVLGWPYRALRFDPVSIVYDIPTADGEYVLKLHFLENRTATSVPPVGLGQRKFSVSVAGSPVIQVVASNLDLYASVGSMAPLVITVPVGVFGGHVKITLVSDIGNVTLSGIELEQVSPVAPLPVTYLTGLDADLPEQCPSGLTLYPATDTGRLYWCLSGGRWSLVGDMLESSQPRLVGLEQYTAKGPGWDSTGLSRVTIKQKDGQVVELNAVRK